MFSPSPGRGIGSTPPTSPYKGNRSASLAPPEPIPRDGVLSRLPPGGKNSTRIRMRWHSSIAEPLAPIIDRARLPARRHRRKLSTNGRKSTSPRSRRYHVVVEPRSSGITISRAVTPIHDDDMRSIKHSSNVSAPSEAVANKPF